MAKVVIETYGCTLNQADSRIMGYILKENGYEVEYGRYEGNADYLIVNTCTVKSPTENKIIYRLRQLKGLGKKLIVAGCLASADTQKVINVVPDASIITTSNVNKIADVLKFIELGKNVIIDSYNRIDKLQYGLENSSIIARIPISEGCLSNCSFCETKFARGPLNSFSEELILRAVKNAVEQGSKEIELTAQDVGAYGADRKTNIAELLKKVVEIEGSFKVRVGMLNPEHLHKYFDELLEAYRSDKVYKFFHLPVQSGSNKVLRDMNRRYTVEDFINYVGEIRKKLNASIATDIIVGYPTESEEDFEKSIELIKEIKPEVVNISKFGARPHAPASRLKQLSDKTIKDRSIILSRIVREIEFNERNKHIGERRKVLITEKNRKSYTGRDDAYNEIAVLGQVNLGESVEVEITGNSPACFVGIPLKSSHE
ncbi:MAG: tRNA (N(6)-L-threonylcarbamoyladenosine(37)-C(2))-methylthiotransferase [Candidatus Micrarchaeota archaeon]